MPSSWRQTLADDALRQAMSPASAVLSECYLSGSLPKASASKRQRVRRSLSSGWPQPCTHLLLLVRW